MARPRGAGRSDRRPTRSQSAAFAEGAIGARALSCGASIQGLEQVCSSDLQNQLTELKTSLNTDLTIH